MPKWIRLALRYLPLVAILGLAAYLRLHQINLYMTFLGDEGRDVLIVKRMIVDGKWTLLGPTASVGGFFMGPAYYYFMLPFLWAWRLNPVGPAIGVALVGIVTVGLVYLLGKRMYGERAGIFAALCYALSPVVIAYSRSSWNPNIVPFFSTSLLLLLWAARKGMKPLGCIVIGIILGIGIQLHYVFLFLFALVGIWMLFVPEIRRDFFRNVFWMIVGFLVGFSPFLLFEIRHGFTNIKAIASFLTAGKETGFQPAAFFPTVWSVNERLFGRLVLRIPDSGMLGNMALWQRTWWPVAATVVTVVSTVSVVWPLVRYGGWKLGIAGFPKPEPESVRKAVLLATWVIAVVGCFGLYRKSIYDYYFGIAFAYPFVAVAGLMERFPGKSVVKTLAGLVVAAGLGIFLWNGRPFIYQPNDQLGQVEKISRFVVGKTEGKPFNFALVAPTNSDHAYRYFFEIWGKPPVTIENTQNDPERKTVTDQLLVVCEDTSCQPLGNSLWEIAGFGRADIAGVWDVSVVKIYRLVHYRGAANP